MRHWMKHFKDWVMTELWTPHRLASESSALHLRTEKNGVIYDKQPIFWNTDAVLVEGLLKLTSNARVKSDYRLVLRDGTTVLPESLKLDPATGRYRMQFRFPAPAHTTVAEFFWKHHPLGRLALPVFTQEDYLRGLRIHLPTIFANMGGQDRPARTIVAGQVKALRLGAVLRHPAGLSPLAEIPIRARCVSESCGNSYEVPIPLAAEQLCSREAMVSASFAPWIRKSGSWRVEWTAGDVILDATRLMAVSRRAFEQSLRISDTRFVVRLKSGELRLTRKMPSLDEVIEAGPLFLISSNEPGMAGRQMIKVRLAIHGSIQPPLLYEQELFITQGQVPVSPGTLDVKELAQIQGFELIVGKRLLGILPLRAIPEAKFNSEGGFLPPPDFAWNAIADDELTERLNQLLQNGKD
jgi:hypothetical protein